jgi:hypothetical protein
MNVGHFQIPGHATRREYAVYVMVARKYGTQDVRMYVGKTGDNKEGCNPVISRAGNHFSFNKIHSQMRNKLPGNPGEYDFDFFYTTFGEYVPPDQSRDGIDLVNEMERQLNQLVQAEFCGKLLNPYRAATPLRKWQRDKRLALATDDRLDQLRDLVAKVREHVGPAKVMAVIDEEEGAS